MVLRNSGELSSVLVLLLYEQQHQLAVTGCLTRHQEVVSNRHGACWSSDTREKRVETQTPSERLHAAKFPTVQLNRLYIYVYIYIYTHIYNHI
jgi:hypothetical protein